jgi:hypothetical protein
VQRGRRYAEQTHQWQWSVGKEGQDHDLVPALQIRGACPCTFESRGSTFLDYLSSFQ